MHIPDGFLDPKTSLAAAGLSAAALAVALRHARLTLPPRKVPLLGLAAAFIFAAQMINFPVLGGTSGHLIGGTLAAVLLGPSAAVIVLTTVLLVQCFAFADGGITTLGANIFNMGIIGGAGGWMIYALLTRFFTTLRGRIIAAILASWISTVFAAVVCAGELAASGTVAWHIAFPAMTGVHALIGIGEGIITALVLAAVASARPELISPAAAAARSLRPVLAYGLLAAVGIGFFVSPFACTWPDGLDKTAGDKGFKDKESEHRALPAPAPDYKIPGISSGALATSIAGAVGTLFVFGGAWLLARSLVPRIKPAQPAAPAPVP